MFLRPPQSSETYHWIRCALVSVWNLVVSSNSTQLYLVIQCLIEACRLLSATTVDWFLISSRVIWKSWRRRHFLSISIRSWKLWKSQDSSALAVSSLFEAFIFMAASAQMLKWVARQLTSVSNQRVPIRSRMAPEKLEGPKICRFRVFFLSDS